MEGKKKKKTSIERQRERSIAEKTLEIESKSLQLFGTVYLSAKTENA